MTEAEPPEAAPGSPPRLVRAARQLGERLARPTDVGALVGFRVALGALVSISAIRFLVYGWVDELFVRPTFFFKYWGFAWVKPLSPALMHGVFVALAVLGGMLAAGLLYRFVAIATLVLFAYIQLIDVTNWLNHYYLVGLLLLLASIMPLGRAWSLDARLFPSRAVTSFPTWCTWLLRVQVGVVYVHAGLAKATSDWLLHAQPLNIWLSARTGMPVVGALFDQRVTAYAFSWAGFLFDTTVVIFLVWRRARPLAYAVVVVFHLMTWLLFPIGMFPFIMMSAALVFMDADWPRRLASRVAGVARARRASAVSEREQSVPQPEPVSTAAPRSVSPAFALALAAFCLVQALAPLRHRLYGGNVLWHEQGMRFAWKVMVREKNGSITYLVESPREKRTWYVSPRKYLTERQERELQSQPDLLLQLAHHIRDDFRARGHDDVRVGVEAIVSLNGRPSEPMIDPKVDLGSTQDGLGKASWILPEPSGPPIHLRSLSSGPRVARHEP